MKIKIVVKMLARIKDSKHSKFKATSIVLTLIILTLLTALPAFSQTFVQPRDPKARATQDMLVRALPVPLNKIRLTGGPLLKAQQLTMDYLLKLEPDRMLALYRQVAGLKPKAEPYGGWDGPGRNLSGHIAGHYLSAVSLMYAATGDPRFKERADYIVKELKEVQDKNGDGYLVALGGGRRCFEALARGEIKAASFDLNGEWSPWYTLHKTFAGLSDAYRLTGNKTALEVEVKFAAWAEKILTGLNDYQLQRMMDTEFGGMNEVLINLYADTGDSRWLKLADKFYHRIFVEPLVRHQDILGGTHGNTQIPKMIGQAVRYLYTGDSSDLMASSFFFDLVAHRHSFSTGGNGMNEYFGPAEELAHQIDGRTAESCNVYNMLKLGRLLFALAPEAHYADFIERALFNHVLGSIDPEDGRMCYMVPVGRAVQHEYQDMFRSFTCCVGSGMENHALHGLGIYYENKNSLWVNLFVPSKAEADLLGASIDMQTDFPEGEKATITFRLKQPKEFTVFLRRPWWAGEGFAVKINGRYLPAEALLRKSSAENVQYTRAIKDRDRFGYYLEIKRQWQSGDVIEVNLPKSLYLEPAARDERIVAIMWGPLVLAGDLGPERTWSRREDEQDEVRPVAITRDYPLLVASPRPVSEWVKPLAGKPGHFETAGVARKIQEPEILIEIELVPFYRLHRRLYSGYWDYIDEAEFQKRAADYKAEAERLKKLEEATVVKVQLGDQKSEKDFNFQAGENINFQRVLGWGSRRGRTWFSLELPLKDLTRPKLHVTYYSEERLRPCRFSILLDGEQLFQEAITRIPSPGFIEKEYQLPEKLTKGKNKITIKFQAEPGSEIAPVVRLRLLR
ncbi:MAG: beta-L-arabinofuranosidase domain-containing protein [Candidatus Saccharicenans sp.]|uniref:beta-L-arabinofuranosidase domain-containing protein n=1 Tax=Candidatus Saccharicenans sp. TaxID=2819258 RepID=UPI00404A3931